VSVISALCRATLGTSLRIDFTSLHFISVIFFPLLFSHMLLFTARTHSLDVIFLAYCLTSLTLANSVLYDYVAHLTNIGYTLYHFGETPTL
jgi:hypothetical protein